MAVEGIGARALRKEDKRFITGKGKYTDDMTMPGMGYAAFVRSPHALACYREAKRTYERRLRLFKAHPG